MTSEVDICNDALGYLGKDASITSIDPADNTAYARTMARFYPRARRRVLADHEWQFATKRSAVLTDTTSTIEHWGYAYAPPSDLVFPIAVLSDEAASDNDGLPFLFENGLIYTDGESVVLRYVYLSTDASTWTEPFCEAVARRLAAMTAGTIIRGADPRNAALLEQNAELALVYAKSHDAKFIKADDTGYVPFSIRAR